MGGLNDNMGSAGANPTRMERRTDRDLVITRRFDAPARLVFEAWTTPALFMRWWAPKSTGMTILSCDMDVRAGGGYKLVFGSPDLEGGMAFHGKYTEVVPGSRLVWTNEESDGGAVTTVTFTETDGSTLLVLHEAYPTKEALDESFEGMESCMPEQYEQLDELLASLASART